MSVSELSRRGFLAAAGAAVQVSLLGGASPTSVLAAPTTHHDRCCSLRVRHNINCFDECQLASLRRGVAVMKSRPVSDPTSWAFQANIHGTFAPMPDPLWNQCEHGSIRFFAWHRGYLHFFERILRLAACDSCLALPYWDWSTSRALPLPFRAPADSGNSLYDGTRHINDGSLLPADVVVDDLNAALAYIPFYVPWPSFSGSLEGSPHGAVHGLTGGNMGSVPTAANDPIFWLHHCNIDRIWDRWLNLNAGRVNPSDPSYLDYPYTFVNECGEKVNVTVRDISNSAQLGYCYDDTPALCPSPTIVAAVTPMAHGADHQQERAALDQNVVATSDKPDGGLRALAQVEGRPLGFKSESVKLQALAQGAARLSAASSELKAGQTGRIALEIQDIAYSETPNFTYGVYVNLDEAETSPERVRLHRVGTVNFFGRDHAAKQGHAHGESKTFTETFDITGVVTRLRDSGRWKADSLSVTLRPVTPVPPKGKEDDLKRRSEDSAVKAKMSYKRINILVVFPN